MGASTAIRFSSNLNAPRLPFFLLTSAPTPVPETHSRRLEKEPALERGQSGVSQIAQCPIGSGAGRLPQMTLRLGGPSREDIETPKTVMDCWISRRALREGGFKLKDRSRRVVTLEADQTQCAMDAGAKCRRGFQPFLRRDAERGFGGLQQRKGMLGGLSGTVQVPVAIGE